MEQTSRGRQVIAQSEAWRLLVAGGRYWSLGDHMKFWIRPQVHISERLSALGLTRHGFVLCRKGVSVGLKDGATVQIRPQVHISERLSALGLTHHGFVLCRKGASVGLKGVDIVYKLPFASSTKRCGRVPFSLASIICRLCTPSPYALCCVNISLAKLSLSLQVLLYSAEIAPVVIPETIARNGVDSS
ncbi:hypothetical protein QL285_077064 [Trifolium repens]|nr:hypothetical protein QL285_077064 [Trifolium repens]